MCLCDQDTIRQIDALKAEADRHWMIDALHSVQLGDEIMRIAAEKQCLWHIALGMMVRGDGLKYTNATDALTQAASCLDQAGQWFLEAGDEVGWARTRIGRLWVSSMLLTDDTQSEIPRALAVLEHNKAHLYHVRLLVNLGALYTRLDNVPRALETYFSALELAQQLDAANGDVVGLVYFNIAAAYNSLGDIDQAEHYYQVAREPLARFANSSLDAVYLMHTATADMRRGAMQNALIRLQKSLLIARPARSPLCTDIERFLAQCYIDLNRFEEALELALQVSARQEAARAYSEQTHALRLIISAYLGLARQDKLLAGTYLDEAQRVIKKAEQIPQTGQLNINSAGLHLLRAQIEMQQARFARALTEGQHASGIYAASGDDLGYIISELLISRALIAMNTDLREAATKAIQGVTFASPRQLEPLHYSAHLTLGRVREKQGWHASALRHYNAATRIAEVLQRDMAITLRPYFLEDKDASLREIIRMHLVSGRAAQAVEALEQLRGQVFLSYLYNRDALRWRLDEPESQRLAAELRELRAEYNRLTMTTSVVEDYVIDDDSTAQEATAQVQAHLRELERTIRGITEQLYLQSGEGQHMVSDAVPQVHEAEIRAKLGAGDMVIEYFGAEGRFWAITVDAQSAEVHELPATDVGLLPLLNKLQENLDCVRPLEADDPFAEALGHTARVIMAQLHKLLIAPLRNRLATARRLYFVPFGALHVIPFNALYSGSEYLIECYEIVTLPSAGLLLREARTHTAQATATVIAYAPVNFAHELPGIAREAAMVAEIFDGDYFSEEAATRAALEPQQDQPVRKLLHIAAHGQFNLSKPELSHIQLADGQLLTDDLLQMDLPYELIVLSACQTGLARVSGGDELIGLGRGFLYAGAAALVTTLWSINDETAVLIMKAFYQALQAGVSKSAALQMAQQSILHQHPATHIAFWAAFQVIGHPDPLISPTSQ